jgi:hypothetical protein
MLDWIGSLRVSERSKGRLVLALSRTTRWAGLGLAVLGAYLTARAWEINAWLALVPAAGVALGVLLTSLKRRMVFDREAGVLRLEQSALGMASQSVVPLFHLRAVVVVGHPANLGEGGIRGARYVAYLDRRVGEAIYLDEARRCARLLHMAELIAEIAELRLEYEAMPRAAGDEL